MQLKGGYKLSEIGSLPEEWRIAPLGELVKSVQYGSSAKSAAHGSVPVLRMGNLQDGKIDWADLVFTNDPREIQKYALSRGDVLFNRTNTVDLVGKTSIFEGSRQAIFAGYLIRVECNRALLNPKFLNYILNAEFSRRYSAKVLSIAVGQANINGEKLRTYPIPLPPTKEEQDAIAAALDDADALIDSLDQLIAKKRLIKQGAMQELLTGKKRLPGFRGEPSRIALGDLGRWVGGMTPSMRNDAYWKGGNVPWVTSGDVKQAVLNSTTLAITDFAIKQKSTTLVPPGTIIVVTRSGILRRYLPVAMTTKPMAINQDVKAMLVDTGVCAEFILHTLICAGKEILARCLKAGTTVESIELRWLKSFMIRLPQFDEQVAIAQLLSDMDDEITALEASLAKARLIKLGVAQELLTGRIRLVQRAAVSVQPPIAQHTAPAPPKTGHNKQIEEAVVIGVLAKHFGSQMYPLANVRRMKLMYLLDRHAQRDVSGYLKKAAGPYKPATRYKGPLNIALKNNYVSEHSNGKYKGLVAGDKIADAESYFAKWYAPDTTTWLGQFKFIKTEVLELWATVDMAVQELRGHNADVSVDSVKEIIRQDKEWRAKLDRNLFADVNIGDAITKCDELFAEGPAS